MSAVPVPAAPASRVRRSIDELLAEARAGLDRLTPVQALAAWRAGAVLVDIRPAAQRAAEGELPGALVIERNVLEWRFDPTCDAALPIASHDLQVVVLCQEGYTSSLAAASLQQLGVYRATDVEGGYAAWRSILGHGLSGEVGAAGDQGGGRSGAATAARMPVGHERVQDETDH